MKKLLALLMMLMLGPVMAQEVNPYANAIPTGNLVPDFSFDGPTGQTPDGWVLDGSNQSGGAIQPGCGALSNQGKCFIFSYAGATLSTTLDLSSFETNSFEYSFSFWYRMNCNNNIGGFCENPLGVRDTFGASFVLNDTHGQAAGINVIPMGNDFFRPGDPGVNEFGYKQINFMGAISSEYLFTSAQLIFYGRDNGFWAGYYGPAIDRVEFSINYLPPPETPPIAPDCTIDPTNTTCIINDLTDFTDTTTLVADTTTDTGSDNGSSDGTEVVDEEETTDETMVADTTEEKNIEEMLIDDDEEVTTTEEKTVVATRDVAYRELTDEEKAALLADAISKSVIESALSIANDASQTNNNTNTNTETTVSKTTTNTNTVSEMMVSDNRMEEVKNETTDTSVNDGLEMLETGRTIGQQALANTMEQTEQSAIDSNNTSEAISVASSFIGISDNKMNTTGMEDLIVEAFSNSVESVETNTMDTMMNVLEENNVASIDNIISEDGRVNLAQFGVVDNVPEDDTKQFEDIVVNNSIDLNGVVFLGQPNVRDLEMLGVIGKVEEKSDAEKRAEEVVAANKEQQDEINKNYMEADQSGIVAAMADGTDVSSYRTAMIPDLSGFYKPEDIYKGVVYKDNARGMYFLEKGNTDTYKKMVEEQYK